MYVASTQGRSQQTNHLDVGLQPGMAVEFGTDLQGLARGIEAGRQGVQGAAAVAQPGDTLAVQQMRIDARHLRRDVGAQTHAATGELIDQLEGAQIQIVAAAGKQRFDILKQRGDDEFVAVTGKFVEQAAPQSLDTRRIAWQDVFDRFRQKPAPVCHRDQRNSVSRTTPTSIEDRPMKRICPSLSSVTRRKVSRQTARRQKGQEAFDHQHQGESQQQEIEHRKPVPIRITCPCRCSSGT